MTRHHETPDHPADALPPDERARLRLRARQMNALLSRRQMLQLGGAVSLGALLAACGAEAGPTPTNAPAPNLGAAVPTAPPNTGMTAPQPTTAAMPMTSGSPTAMSAMGAASPLPALRQ